MKANAIAAIAVLSSVCSSWAAQVLPMGRESASSEAFAAIRLQAMDDAAERGWLGLKSRAEYDAHRNALRGKMLEAMGAFPERTPLNPVVRATYEREGYRVEKVVFWSMPGVPVTANVFSPAAPGRHPAVVMSCGHSADGKDAPRYLRACVLAAKRGFVALMFDPYEQGERQTGEPYISTRHHNQIGLLGSLMDWSMPLLRVWDGMRAIDYVASRADVDPSRIGYMGQWLGYRFGVVPQLVAEGPLAIPAAHAFAAGTNAWMGVEIVNRSPSWKEVIGSGIAIRMHYADLVPRAYLHYDWPDLLQ